MAKLTSSKTPTSSHAPASSRSQTLNLILLGPPGAGKGTQAVAIAGSLGLRHLSTGDLFRQHMQQETELGAQAKLYYDKGEYVPDRLVIAMVKEELSLYDFERGVVLDGYPRTVAQAEALAATMAELGQSINAVIELASDPEEIVKRAQGRRLCPKGHTYHLITNPPRVSGRCDIDGLSLEQRVDDRPATVRKRIETYRKQTQPLLSYYAERRLLRYVDGTQNIDKVTDSIANVLSQICEH